MNLANMASGRTPWAVLGSDGSAWPPEAFSIQLTFDIAAAGPPSLAEPGITLAEPWLTEPRDTSWHGAELAALLALSPAETGFPPLPDEVAPGVLSLEAFPAPFPEALLALSQAETGFPPLPGEVAPGVFSLEAFPAPFPEALVVLGPAETGFPPLPAQVVPGVLFLEAFPAPFPEALVVLGPAETGFPPLPGQVVPGVLSLEAFPVPLLEVLLVPIQLETGSPGPLGEVALPPEVFPVPLLKATPALLVPPVPAPVMKHPLDIPSDQPLPPAAMPSVPDWVLL